MSKETMAENPTIQALLLVMEAKHSMLLTHALHTMHVAEEIAVALNVPEEEMDDVRNASLLHDIGKIYITDSILGKAEGLTEREMEIMREHSMHSKTFLLQLKGFEKYANIVVQHHEKPCGGGYPLGLTLDEINPLARVINIADRFSAFTEHRPYRKAHPMPEVIIKQMQGDIKEFFPEQDEAVTSALMDILNRRASCQHNPLLWAPGDGRPQMYQGVSP